MNITGNNSILTNAQSQVQSKNISKNNDQTTIQSTNDMTTESDRRMKILDEKYSKINEQNKRFENPHNHIFDKYRNKDSPYFRSDLTKKEREAAYSMEMSWANSGTGGQYNFNDAAFRNERPYDPTQESAERKVFNRQKVNGQLQDLFSTNGINIPLNTNLRFTIDPDNFKLTVNRSEDETLVSQLENLLNTNNNARELFFHIMKSRSDDSTQFTPKSLEKFRLVNQIKTVTGYDLKELELVDDKFITKSGTDIFEIYKEQLLKNPYTAKHANIAASHYGSQLHELAKNGFDSIPDLILSIDYKNGSLNDID
ncbi:DUF4885 domain-containing protein [Sporosarcina sp. PTS2304]|uniref:DUF4885 family protein n=1 Tax=Sporosarcina sp. PTS2304 TaxID=2283194 RepID=UPI000E0CCD59|nr:DUF4885 family protein [Sporosarcina sp. PTS2304]AXI00554.1 DUF4885 domain-containing protein [Sporosarcina sp. PTS2304]